jgi:hypothetical protein
MKWVFGILAALSALCFFGAWHTNRHKQAADDEEAVAILVIIGAVCLGLDGAIFTVATLVRIWTH